MASTRTLQQSFNGGEVTPEFFGRIEDVKRLNGAETISNFVVLPQGPAVKRSGFAFVHKVKNSSKKTRLIPFVYSSTQTFVIEMGEGYFRFHTEGGTVLIDGTPLAWNSGTNYIVGDLVSYLGNNYYCRSDITITNPTVSLYWYSLPATGEYEIPHPYGESYLFDVNFVQSADVMTLVSTNYPPRELRRHGARNWQTIAISFASELSAPISPSASPTGSGSQLYEYTVTSVDAENKNESTGLTASCTNDLLTTGNYNTISWLAMGLGASRTNIYKKDNGLYGYIGQTNGLSFNDDNITADLSRQPPIQNDPFNADDLYPGAVGYFEQRRVFAGSILKPQNIWMTRSGTESNLTYSIPSRDDDAISFRMASRENNIIRHIVPLGDLLLLTNAAEWRISTVNSDAITPTTVSVRPQSYVGANNVQPIVVNNLMVYAESRGGHVREMGYNQQAGGYMTNDLSIRSPHLFDNKNIVDMAYAKSPFPVCWFVRDDGVLLGLTYVPEQQVSAWHQHHTDGLFESVCVVPEGNEDAVYVVVKREIDGNNVRYIERMASRFFTNPEDAFFVDCGATYSGAPNDTISGLDFIEGKTVNILADGAVHPQRVVTGGSVTLDIEASVVHIGLPIVADLKTLPMALPMDAYGQGRHKNINKAWLRLYRSSGVFVGFDSTHLTEIKQRRAEPYGSPPNLLSEEIEVMVSPSWNNSGQLLIRHSNPLPLTVVSMTMEVVIGG